MSELSKKLLEESMKRRSYRKFVEHEIDKETIEHWLLTASSAPSGANKQPWYFCVVTSPGLKAEIREEAEFIEEQFYEKKITDEWRADLEELKTNFNKPFLTEASCLIIVFKELYKIDDSGVKEKNYYVNESVGLATGLLINAIRHSGYKSLTYTPAPPNFLKTLFDRPEGETPVMIIAVGKGDTAFELPSIGKKEINDIATFYE